jgi:hypothetical protein
VSVLLGGIHLQGLLVWLEESNEKQISEFMLKYHEVFSQTKEKSSDTLYIVNGLSKKCYRYELKVQIEFSSRAVSWAPAK